MKLDSVVAAPASVGTQPRPAGGGAIIGLFCRIKEKKLEYIEWLPGKRLDIYIQYRMCLVFMELFRENSHLDLACGKCSEP